MFITGTGTDNLRSGVKRSAGPDIDTAATGSCRPRAVAGCQETLFSGCQKARRDHA
ncbi:MAG: hypothetical protein IH627_17185 [Rubrivivax sp.]|nr:hypothetical protein [Rubrivivax sp.]